MKIIFAASEGVPYCKTGGLADVIGALPAALASQKHELRVFLPYYRIIKEQKLKIKNTGLKFHVPLAGTVETVQLLEAEVKDNHRVYFVESDKYFDRPGIYGEIPGTDFPDNYLRYALFSRAVLEGAKALGFKPDVINGHDWQTGPIAAYLNSVYKTDEFFKNTATVFSIHNMAYQGIFPKTVLEAIGLPWSLFHSNGLEFYDQVNFLKAGLAFSDGLSTVSETYAKEIVSSYEFGFGLEGFLKTKKSKLRGIRNGLDINLWDPSKDTFLIKNFDQNSLAERARCKAELQKLADFKEDKNIPVLGFVGRLDPQKGIDILVEIAPALINEGAQLIFLGVGDPRYQQVLLEMQRRHPASFFVETRFAESFAHLIYAGSDLFLMPSKFEPCGLGQMIAMRYGSLPVVSPTGGLLDTVTDSFKSKKGTGFVSVDRSAMGFLKAVHQGLRFFKKKKDWSLIQKRAMGIDFSWKKSVEEYVDLYENALKWHQVGSRGKSKI